MDEIRIRVKCFSIVKDALGGGEIELILPAGAAARDVESRVREMAKGALARVPLRVAVNREYCSEDTILKDGDEAAVLPPVQGG